MRDRLRELLDEREAVIERVYQLQRRLRELKGAISEEKSKRAREADRDAATQ